MRSGLVLCTVTPNKCVVRGASSSDHPRCFIYSYFCCYIYNYVYSYVVTFFHSYFIVAIIGLAHAHRPRLMYSNTKRACSYLFTVIVYIVVWVFITIYIDSYSNTVIYRHYSYFIVVIVALEHACNRFLGTVTRNNCLVRSGASSLDHPRNFK